MDSKSEITLCSKSRLLLYVTFFLPCFLYVWIFIKPDLIYHGFGTIIPDVPLFSTGWQFLSDTLGVPGGLTFYVYGFLSQWYYYPPLGALIIVLITLCLCELSRRHYNLIGHSRPIILHYMPAIIIILSYNQYNHPLAACLASSIGLLFSLILEKMTLRGPVRMIIFCIIAATCYCLAGTGGVVVFSLLTTIYLVALRRDWLQAVFTLPATAAIILVLAEYSFHMSPKQAFEVLTPFSRNMTRGSAIATGVLIVTLYALVPVTVMLIYSMRALSRKIGNARAAHRKKAKNKKKHEVGKIHRASSAYFKKLAPFVIPIAVLAGSLYFSYDKVHRQIVLVNSLSRRGRWSEVLELGQLMPRNIYNIYCNHDINRALYHSGRLAYDMFYFPQNPHSFLLTHDKEESSTTQLKMCNTFIELGNLNYAEKLASEFMVEKGGAGVILEKLAWINIIQGQEYTARVYLNAMKKDLIYGRRADLMLAGLNSGFEPAMAAHIRQLAAHIRSEGKTGLDKESVEDTLTGLLKHNPGNKMAFEYLMACYLFAGQLDKIAENIGRLKEFGYQDVPTLYEEAMLLYYGSHGQKLNLSELNIRRETIERHRRFVQLCNSIQLSNRELVFQRMINEFGTSYLFYYFKLTTSSLAKTSKK